MPNPKMRVTGRITSGISPNTLVLRTIDFVYRQLPAWRDYPFREDVKSENKLNLQLCKFLDSKARESLSVIRFDHEEYQTGQYSVDISASPDKEITIGAKFYTPLNTVTVFECKRLPAHSNNLEKDYVTGGIGQNKGGIKRFKLGLHGANHDIVAMIGYLQKDSVDYWYDKINNWIKELTNGMIRDDCNWDKSEVLKELEKDFTKLIAKYQSNHDRSGSVKSNKILIQHLWIMMYV